MNLQVCVLLQAVPPTSTDTGSEGMEDLKDIESKVTSEVGYSFWLAVGALVLAVVDIVLGALTVCMGESCL
ncbi:hypothetical protein OSTOST_00278 [Ostertagia ostertagi]